MPPQIPPQRQNIGNSGEYYVAARLSALNFITTITLGRAECYDILAVSPTGKTYKFSIKSRFRKESTAFTLSEKDERNSEPDLFYILVRLHEFKREPEMWIIPSKRVAEVVASSHRKWRNTPRRDGKPHNDSSLRKIPIQIHGQDEVYYPNGWAKEMEGYYMNFSVLK